VIQTVSALQICRHWKAMFWQKKKKKTKTKTKKTHTHQRTSRKLSIEAKSIDDDEQPSLFQI
jgi:hypothetical protein